MTPSTHRALVLAALINHNWVNYGDKSIAPTFSFLVASWITMEGAWKWEGQECH